MALSLLFLPLPVPAATVVPLDPNGFVIGFYVAQWKRAVVQPGPDIDLHNELKGRVLKRAQKKGARTTLEASLVVQKAGLLQFKMGCTRSCRLFVDGRPVLHVDKPYRAFMDDSAVSLTLTPGTHKITVKMHRRVRGSRHRQRLFLRIHDGENKVPNWIHTMIAGATDEAQALANALDVQLSHQLSGKHLNFTLEAGPTGQFGTAIEVLLGTEKAVTTRGEKVVITHRVEAGNRLTWRMQVDGRVLRQGELSYRAEPRYLAAVAQAKTVLATTETSEDARATLEWGVQHFSALVAKGDSDTVYLDQWAATLTRQSAATAAGQDFLTEERGALWRAYRSPLDGRLQPYALYLPKSWRGSRAWPLHVALHPSGFSPMLTLRLAMGKPMAGGKRLSERRLPRFVNRGAIVVAPYGYRGTGGRYQGKVDVLEVISRVQKRYGTHPQRVTLSGGSLGGLGSFHIGLRMPDRFNAIIPMAGYGSVRLYGDVAGVKKKPWENFLVARRDNTTFVENARHLPMLCVHGDRDNPRRSEVIVNRYKKLGYRHQYELLEDTGHNAWDDGYKDGFAFRYARKFRRPKSPRNIRFVSGSYRHRSAYWLQIEQFAEHNKLGRIRAQRSRKKTVIKTQNIRRLSINQTAPSRVIIDKQSFDESQFGRHWIRTGDGRWKVVQDGTIPLGEKRPGLSGPIDDIRYEAHLFVYGTSDPAQTETNRRRAEHASRYWWNSANIQMPVIADTALDYQQVMNKHLVLIGNPRSNSFLASLADRLPVKWEDNAVVMGGRRFEGPSVGVSFIFPNPLSPNHYLLVHAGVKARGTWLSAWLPRWLPDFVVYDDGISVQRGGRLMDKRKPLFAGYFSRRWRLPAQ
jgi:hypothetical protein